MEQQHSFWRTRAIDITYLIFHWTILYAISNADQVGQVAYSAVGLRQMESLLHDILIKAGLGDLSGLHSK
jgi:hypothetical protein